MAVDLGQQVPDITFTDTDRQQKKISDFAGKTLVLAFFPGAFTGVCTKEACTFRDSAAEYASLNAQVVGVTVDSIFALKAWGDQNSITYPLVSDQSRAAVTALGTELPNFGGMPGYVSSKRAVFVIDKAGVLRYTETTANPGVEPDYEALKQAVAAAR